MFIKVKKSIGRYVFISQVHNIARSNMHADKTYYI